MQHDDANHDPAHSAPKNDIAASPQTRDRPTKESMAGAGRGRPKHIRALGRMRAIPLSEITGVHPSVSKLCVSCRPYVSTGDVVSGRPRGIFSLTTQRIVSPRFANELCMTQPILVSPIGSRYGVVAGFRTWLIARRMLPAETLIDVRVLKRMSDDDRISIARADLFLPLIAFLLIPDQAASAGRAWRAIGTHDPEWRESICPGIKTNRQFAQFLGRALGTVFPPGK